MGGMAAQIPIKGDDAANDAAMAKVRADKLREVRAGHDGTWVAHPGLVSVAKEVFDAHMPAANQIDKHTDKSVRATQLAISVEAGSAVTVSSETEAGAALNTALGDEQIPKAIHDWKTAAHAYGETTLAGIQHDTRLYSYLLDPTYSSHSSPEVALRRFNLKLGGSLAEAADLTGRLAMALGAEVDGENLRKLYDEIDLPLVPCSRAWSRREWPSIERR